ncbi:MAG: prolipoprotein diacylglyceryl transferase, partial [Acidobacteria bacterium]|nr:prolipoprotein diacylglyceryl transferase [Acidobacteriota bacterium]
GVTVYDPTGYYLSHPLEIILPFSMEGGQMKFHGISGMSYHGGLIGTVVALVIFMKVKKLDILEWGDMLVAGIPLGYTFGRLSDFFDGELYGRITRLPWGIVFPNAEGFPVKARWVQDFAAAVGLPLPSSGVVNLPRHPSQLYEALFEGIVLWVVLWFFARKRRPYKGFVIASYLIGYGVLRFFLEYARQPDQGIGFPVTLTPLRDPSQFSPFNFTAGQILNLLMVIAGVACLFAFRARARQVRVQPNERAPSGRRLRKLLK